MSTTSENEWDAYAPSWDADPDARAYAQAAFDNLATVLTQTSVTLPNAQVLDFGCGTGLLTEQLVSSGAAVDALDTSPAMREVVRAKIEAQHWSAVELAGHLEDLHPQRRYDLIVCSSVCSFLPDYPGEVERLVGGLRPGGVFVQWDWERTAGGDSGLSRDEVRETLRRACLTDVHVGTAFEIAMGGQPARPLIGWGQKAP